MFFMKQICSPSGKSLVPKLLTCTILATNGKTNEHISFYDLQKTFKGSLSLFFKKIRYVAKSKVPSVFCKDNTGTGFLIGRIL